MNIKIPVIIFMVAATFAFTACAYFGPKVPVTNTNENPDTDGDGDTSTNSLVYHLTCSEGNGTVVSDAVSGKSLNAVGTEIQWCRGDVKGLANKTYIKSGMFFNLRGGLTGNIISKNIKQYTVTFLARLTDAAYGPVIRFSNLHRLSFNGTTWEFDDGAKADVNDIRYNTWSRVSFVQTGTEQYIYIDNKLSGQGTYVNTISSGTIFVGTFDATSTDYLFPGEYTDIRIYDYAMTSDQIKQLSDADGVNGEFVIYGDGSSYAGLWKHEMHFTDQASGHVFNCLVSNENVSGNMRYKHWYNGGTSYAPISIIIPPGNPSLWFSADFIYPENLDANHYTPGSAKIDTIELFSDYDRNDSGLVATIGFHHDDSADTSIYPGEGVISGGPNLPITVQGLSFRTQAGGAFTQISLVDSAIVIQKGVVNHLEIHYTQGTGGSIAFYLNGNELYSTTGDFGVTVVQAMYGTNFGIHPQNDGCVLYTDNIYAGKLRYDDYLNSK